MFKKLTSLNQCISEITDIDEKWLVIFEYTINHLSFGDVRLPCGVLPSHLTLEGPQMTSSLQDTQKEIFMFRFLFIFKIKT